MRLTRTGLLTAILVIVALFVGSAITDRMPTTDAVHTAPYLRPGRLGEPVALRTGTVTVTDLRAAPRVVDGVDVAATQGVWIVVDLTWLPTHEPMPLVGSALRWEAPDGRSFGMAMPVTLGCGPGQPGLELTCQLPFEVTRDAVEGGRLFIPAGPSVKASDDVAVIDFGLDADRARALTEASDPITVHRPTERGR